MSRTKIQLLLLLSLFCILAFNSSVISAESEQEDEPLIGDEGDGGMSPPIHLIPLYPEDYDFDSDEFIKGDVIDPAESNPLAFSTRYTCGECHSYDIIKHGWHFNSIDSNIPSGRSGEPWIYFESKLFLQIPLSYRQWPGLYKPEDIGLSAYKMTTIFGRAMPGGGTGEIDATAMDDIGDQMSSGKLEINCLACHNGHYGQDMGGENGYALQVSQKNFRWAAAGSSEFADVSGAVSKVTGFYDPFMPSMDENAPKVSYHEEFFNEDNEVLMDIVREVPDTRCYFCHSEFYQKSNIDGEEPEKWTSDMDIHLSAGLTCVDCHRNGNEHDIIRGYEGEELLSDNELVSVSTCMGCHLPEDAGHHGPIPEAGRLGAPIPKHAGIPAVHFERLTCTACHCGPWPRQQTDITKTSRNHKLNVTGSSKSSYALPHIVSPVFATGYDGKIGPYRAVWPSFWATIEDGNTVPLELEVLDKVLTPLFEDMFEDNLVDFNNGWWDLTDEMMTDALVSLSSAADANVVYISAGSLFSLEEPNTIIEQKDYPAAEPYLWPIAHNVRPAAQALGVRYCTDCHSSDAPIFFGDVKIDTPVLSARGSVREMIRFQDISRIYAWAFAVSFVFRPWLKIIAIGCCAVIAAVLLLYALKALAGIVKAVE